MRRNVDNSSVPNTCPKIDEVISCVRSVTFDENSWWDEDRVIEILEDIRSANSSLREWGNEMYKEKEKLEEENNDLESKVKELEDEVAYLNKIISEYESKN